MAPEDGRPRSPRALVVLLAFLAASGVAVAAWRAGQAAREARLRAGASPDAGAPPEVLTGRIVSVPRPLPAPALELADAAGGRFSLGAARGKVVVVNFWATWCEPCTRELPTLVALGEAAAAAHPGQLQVVAVSLDESAAEVKAFFDRPPFGGLPRGLTVAIEAGGGEGARGFRCAGRRACGPGDQRLPESYLVDRAGRIVAFVVGDIDWSGQPVRDYLEALLRG